MDQAQDSRAAFARYSRQVVTWYIVLVLIWTIGGMAIWTGVLKPLLSRPYGQPVALALAPFGILTWPAHEAAMCMEGKGLGANALCQLSPGSLLAFILWSGLLWAPLLLRLARTIPLRLSMATQVLVLILTFALFWRYGNG
jgi:hypothetical protein